MSGVVSMRVTLATYDEDLAAGTSVVANLLPVKKGVGTPRKGLVVPAGFDVALVDHPVDPGRYAVEVILPSGRILTDEVEVGEGERVTREFDVEDSPYETHSWQYLSGNVERGDAFWRKDEETAPVAPPPEVSWLPAPGESATSWAALNAAAQREAAAPVTSYDAASVPVAAHPDSSLGLTLYRLTSAGTIHPAMDVPGAHPMLHVAFPTGYGDSHLLRLPIPWESIETGRESVAEVMIDRRPDRPAGPISVTVRDPMLGGALAYLGNGSPDMAAPIVARARDMLFGKVINPLAAAAGGYMLVGTKTDDDPAYWIDWIGNLRNWFEWLPDGAILDAAVHLRFGTGDEAYGRAREALLEAYGRGIPWYSVGLRWLLQGLSQFPDDPECGEAFAHVQRLSWRVDTQQPFLVVRTNRR